MESIQVFSGIQQVQANEQIKEKAAIHEIEETDEEFGGKRGITEEALAKLDITSGDPFPEDPVLRSKETRQCTIRSVVIGCLVGAAFASGNMYLSWKTGFGMDAGILAIFVGYGIMRLMQNKLPPSFGGGFFGPKENVSCQSAANGSCSGGGIFAAAVPAMFQLGLLSTPKAELGQLIGLGFVCAFFGTFLAIPLRKFYILRQRCIFPAACASAITIRSIHSSGEIARKQIKALFSAFGAAFVWNIARDYARGILHTWEFFWWLYLLGAKGAIAPANWSWGLVETTPCFFGIGMIAGLNTSLSFYLGAVLAWGVVGPITVATGLTKGKPVPGKYPGKFNYSGAARGGPRYWLLWPGLVILMVSAFMEVGLQWRSIGQGVKLAWSDICNTIRRRPLSNHGAVDDPAAPHEQVPVWVWLGGLIGSIAISMVILQLKFGVPPYNTLLGIILAVPLACVGLQATATTSINPVGPVAKFSQLIFGGISKAQGHNMKEAQMSSLIAGSLAGQAASHSVDMVGDFKIGHLLGATPRGQAIAQIVGTLVGIVPVSFVFLVYGIAYPCALNVNDDGEKCPFEMPAATAWRAVAMAMTQDDPLPLSAGIAALIMGGLVIITFVIRERLHPKYRPFVPNWSAMGLAWVIPNGGASTYSFAMVVGAFAAHFARRYWPRKWDIYGFSIAAGLAAGEACSGIVQAGLVIGGVDGGTVGSEIGVGWT